MFTDCTLLKNYTNSVVKKLWNVKQINECFCISAFVLFSKWNSATEFFNISPGESEVNYTSCLKQIQNIGCAATTLVWFPLTKKQNASVFQCCEAVRAKGICKKGNRLGHVLPLLKAAHAHESVFSGLTTALHKVVDDTAFYCHKPLLLSLQPISISPFLLLVLSLCCYIN